MTQSTVPEGMVKLAHALVETPHLRSWFYSLEPLPRAQRQTEFIHMAHQMRTAREDPELVSAVAMLAYREIYEASSRRCAPAC